MAKPALSVVAVGGLVACGGEEIGYQPLVVGTATADAATFVPVDSGSDLGLLPGTQGGFHIFIRVRLGSAHVDKLGTEWVLRREARRVDTGAMVSQAEQRITPRGNGLRMVPTGEPGLLETDKSMLLFLCPTPEGVAVADRLLRVEISASAEGTTSGPQGDLLFRPRCLDSEQRSYCEEICSG